MKPLSILTAIVTLISFSNAMADGPKEPPLTSPIGPPPKGNIDIANSPYAIRPVYKKPVSNSKISESRILSLYHQIRPGQSKAEVEKLLGKPVTGSTSEHQTEQWYINETETKEIKGSPWGLAGIVVYFDPKDRVVAAKYNFQYVQDKHIALYHKKHAKPAAKEDAN